MKAMRCYRIMQHVIAAIAMTAAAACTPSSEKKAEAVSAAGDDRPPLEFTDADRVFSVILEISSDSLLACNNNFSCRDDNPLILDTSNPEFFDNLSGWFASMDSTQLNRLRNNSTLHISVGDNVADATVEKVKRSVREIGIEGISISNF